MWMKEVEWSWNLEFRIMEGLKLLLMIYFRVWAWKVRCWGRIGDKINRKEVKQLKVQVLKEWPMRILPLPKTWQEQIRETVDPQKSSRSDWEWPWDWQITEMRSHMYDILLKLWDSILPALWRKREKWSENGHEVQEKHLASL